MERLKDLKNRLLSCVESAMVDLNNTDTKELKEAIEAIHYLDESIYYCTIVKAMEEGSENEAKWYTEPSSRNGSTQTGRMYYPIYGNDMYTQPKWYTEPRMMRDAREGRSPMQRRMYMEATNQTEKMKELEKQIKELTDDLTDMIKDASPEERDMLHKKISTLATKLDV